jgi:hypothetical protein
MAQSIQQQLLDYLVSLTTKADQASTLAKHSDVLIVVRADIALCN